MTSIRVTVPMAHRDTCRRDRETALCGSGNTEAAAPRSGQNVSIDPFEDNPVIVTFHLSFASIFAAALNRCVKTFCCDSMSLTSDFN